MIDAYIHCGISKFLPLPDVQEVMAGAGVERAVVVQHLGEYDNSYIESIVEAHPDTFRAVGLVDVTDAGWPAALDALLASGRFTGLRLREDMLAANPEVGFAAAAAGLAFVLELPSGVGSSLPAVQALLERGAGPVFVAHLGYPKLEDGRIARGRELLELAESPHVHPLLTGHSMWFDYPYTELAGYTTEVIETFGPDRVLWGSNFPVCGGADVYRRDLELLRGGAYGLSAAEAHLVTHANAERLWFS